MDIGWKIWKWIRNPSLVPNQILKSIAYPVDFIMILIYSIKEIGGEVLLNIAIVEDDDKEAAILEKYIKEYGEKNNERFSIERFEHALSLLENYRHVHDIIFMDIMMPEINGMEAAIKLRKLDKVD